jgi:hypothetical protein
MEDCSQPLTKQDKARNVICLKRAASYYLSPFGEMRTSRVARGMRKEEFDTVEGVVRLG